MQFSKHVNVNHYKSLSLNVNHYHLGIEMSSLIDTFALGSFGYLWDMHGPVHVHVICQLVAK